MLELLRKAANTLPFKIFFVILIASFGVWGIDALRGNGLGTQVATVGDGTISAVEYDKALRIQVEKAREITKGQVSTSTFIPMIQSQVYQQLVRQKLLDILANNMNLDISDKIIKKVILEQYAMQDQTFSPEKFKTMLQRAGYSEKQFFQVIEADLKRRFIGSSIFPAISIPMYLVSSLHKDYYTPRMCNVVIFTEKNIKIKKAIKDKDLRDFYQKNQSMYQVPELRTVEAFIFNPKDQANIGKKAKKSLLSNTEKQQEAIEKNFKLTQEVEDALASGMTFQEVSKKYNLPIHKVKHIDIKGRRANKEDGILTSFITSDMLETAFEMDVDEESELHSLRDGRSYIIKTSAIKKSRTLSFKEAYKEIRKDYILTIRKKSLKESLKKYLKELEKGTITLVNLSKKLGVKVRKFKDIRATKDIPSDLTVDVVEEILKTPKKSYFSSFSGDKGYLGIVNNFSNIPTVSKARKKENIKAINQGLANNLSAAFLKAIIEELKRDYSVKPNEVMIQNILANYR